MFFTLGKGFGFHTHRGGGSQYEDLLPALGVSPTSYNYGEHDTGTDTDYIFTLTNSGNEIAEDITVAVTGTGFSLLSSAGPFNVAADGGTANVTVRFSPSAAGATSGSLTLSWPNRDDIVVALSGTGVATGAVYSDNFDRADANPIGGNWVTLTGLGNLKILSNAAKAASTGTYSAAYYNQTFAADQYSEITVGTSENYSGLILRASTTEQTAYRMFYSNSYYYFFKWIAGVSTQLDMWAGTLAAGDKLKFSVQGTTLTAYKNGSSIRTKTDSSISSGKAGIFMTYSSALDWAGGDL